ncbi:cobalamin binding intrinsic factor-like [Hemiscyllium ocellatum]|uniref:cobalamin binding intrinsic factor-like n=1 Tax=Hemiscyllium ocellatum TaxID=170820 RepID=UPI002967516E|nr:cobalamin binding intrinsic factor-like [Hemiscyllium ocellatum]
MVHSVNSSGGPPNPSVHVALRLARDHHLPTEGVLLQQLKVSAIEKVKHGDNFSSGLVALYSLAIAASCNNPANVSYKEDRIDLIEILQEKLTEEIKHIVNTTFPLTNYYQVSLDVLTLCVLERELPQDSVQILCEAAMKDKFKYGKEFSVDTGAVAALALRCVKGKPNTQCTFSALHKVLNQILHQVKDDGIIGNIYSTGLAIQALSANSDLVPSVQWNKTKSMYRLLSAIREGSFSNPQAASQITPSLECRTYLDVRELNCTADRSNLTVTTTSPPPTTQAVPITVEYNIVDGLTHSFNDAVNVSVLAGSPLIRVLEKARDLYPDRFSFNVTSTQWGPLLTTVRNLTASTENRTYWQLLSGTEPLGQGIGDYKPKDEERIVANYTQY